MLFNKYLNIIYQEAIKKEKTQRVIDIFQSHISRIFNQDIYVQQGTIKIEKENGDIIFGTMFMFQDGVHAFRLNWASNVQNASIKSVDFWLKPAPNPQLTVNTEKLNIIQIIKLIDNILNKGIRRGTIKIDKNNNININEEIKFKIQKFNEDEQHEYKTQKINKLNKKENIAVVTIQSAPKEQVVAEKPDEWDELFDKPLTANEIFALIEEAVEKVKNGTQKALLITGDPGIGKTYSVKKQLRGVDHEFYTGSITSASALYKVLFINNDPDKIIVFDDLDHLFDDRECVNILKGALDSGSETEVSYISNNTVPPLFYEIIKNYDNPKDVPFEIKQELLKQKIDVDSINIKVWEIYKLRAASPTKPNALMPNKFNFDGRVIFISNKYISQIPGPIRSRTMVIEVSLTLDEIINRIKAVLDKIDIPGVTYKHKLMALDFIEKKVIPSKRIFKIDFRTFNDIVKFAASNAPEQIWHRWAAATLIQKYGNQKSDIRK